MSQHCTVGCRGVSCVSLIPIIINNTPLHSTVPPVQIHYFKLCQWQVGAQVRPRSSFYTEDWMNMPSVSPGLVSWTLNTEHWTLVYMDRLDTIYHKYFTPCCRHSGQCLGSLFLHFSKDIWRLLTCCSSVVSPRSPGADQWQTSPGPREHTFWSKLASNANN